MLEAYIDESGIQDDRFCVVAGFVGTSQKWSIFEECWRRATRGVLFHARRFFGRNEKGERLDLYADWSDAQALEYLNRVLDVIVTRANGVLTPVGCVVDVQAFKALSESDRRYLTGRYFDKRRKAITTGALSRPYFVAFPWCFAQSAICVPKAGVTVDFVFDKNPSLMGFAGRLYETVEKHANFSQYLGTLAFKQSKEVAGLQAADLLAYCCYQRALEDFHRKPELAHAIKRIEVVVLGSRKHLAWLDDDALRAILGESEQNRRHS